MKVPAPEVEQDFQKPIENMVGNDEVPSPEPQEQGYDSPFKDQEFDAGIDVDEKKFPQKYIQKLSGKLSQVLRKYNEETPGDEDLNKYVVNFIISAAVPNLSGENAKDVVKKVEDNIGKEKPVDNNQEDVQQELNQDQQNQPQEQQPPMNNNQPPKMEGKINKNKKVVKEIKTLDEIIDDVYCEEINSDEKQIDNLNTKKSIFKTPEFK